MRFAHGAATLRFFAFISISAVRFRPCKASSVRATPHCKATFTSVTLHHQQRDRNERAVDGANTSGIQNEIRRLNFSAAGTELVSATKRLHAFAGTYKALAFLDSFGAGCGGTGRQNSFDPYVVELVFA
jgi:hypothetical protein